MKRMFVLLAGAVLAAFPALAQQPRFPDKSITVIVPFAAGGPTDVVARQVAEAMSRALGVAVVAENVTGAGGTLGAQRVVQARPDGYTLLLGNIGVATAPTLYRRPPYDPLTQLDAIGLITPVPMTLIGRPDLPAKNLPELLAWLRRPGAEVNIAHAGLGSASQLCGTLLRSILQTPMTPVAFRGTAPVMTEMMAGRIDITCDQTTNTVPYIRDNRVRAFAVTTPQRLAALPDVPTTTEGGLPQLQVTIWHGFYAPHGTPRPVIDRLAQSLRAALADPAVLNRFSDLATTAEPPERATPDAHRAFLEAEIARWRPILSAAGEYAD
ncbi:tripartite tricarboxylate transporter substrate-binding protein [Pararoseomonas indoligenes]|uniref:Tripartite tricarboxylate transporter substrate binding protein BugD n=1 Tax=Roseomonas indoligenes TaxID=2820811 RepID=A0A940MY48_9PROT|nr:tripartite tricarboxylate transporter substrate-binding protein [Pararoseomonas indoligenes]MBP0495529.1 tripartite tricarboxylate transporter substrate binding protein BugD [Pararoseomonas indoligenes]